MLGYIGLAVNSTKCCALRLSLMTINLSFCSSGYVRNDFYITLIKAEFEKGMLHFIQNSSEKMYIRIVSQIVYQITWHVNFLYLFVNKGQNQLEKILKYQCALYPIEVKSFQWVLYNFETFYFWILKIFSTVLETSEYYTILKRFIFEYLKFLVQYLKQRIWWLDLIWCRQLI